MADGKNQAQGEGQTLEQQRAQAQQQGGRLQGNQQQGNQQQGNQQQGNQQQGNQQQGKAGQSQGGQQQGGHLQGGQQDSFQRGVQAGDQVRRQQYDAEKQLVGERPQGVGGNPTPTQQENDEIGAGLRHVDDKQDDGSGPDPKFAFRRVADADPDSDRRRGGGQRQLDAEEQKGKYETR